MHRLARSTVLSLLVPGLLVLVGCSAPLSLLGRDASPDPQVAVTEMPGDDVMRPRARQEQARPAPPAPAADGFVGETLAGLGAPGETGLWLRTGLVAETTRGRIVTEAGRSLTLELRASGAEPGAGSQISLMAMQSLGLAFGQLATLRVYVD